MPDRNRTVPLHHRTISSLQQALAASALTTADIGAHFSARIARYNPQLNAFLHIETEQGAAEGPLLGMPIGIKNNIAVAGMPLTAGIGARRDMVADTDAPVVTALKAAGAIISGTLNMHEAALGATTDNVAYGRCHNPHGLAYTPGGSSGGSASAVAAGLCVAALGTDTLGSIRIPASFCGVYGLKPTFGLVSNAGTVPMGSRFDCTGPIARSISDLRTIWDVIGAPGSAAPIRKIATLANIEAHAMDRPVRQAYDLAVALTRGLETPVEAHGIGTLDFTRTLQASLVEIERECLAYHSANLARDREGFTPELRAFLDFGAKLGDGDVAAARAILDGVAQALHGVLAACDAIIMPTTPCVPFPFSQKMPDDIAHFTMLANIAGLPAIALPCGWSDDGLPIGVQIMGRAGSERALLDFAQKLDSAAGGYVFPSDFDTQEPGA